MEPILSSTTLALFLPAVLLLLITPGPVVLYIVTRSIDQGRRAGLVSVLGSEIGNLVHVLAAALGLSAILLSSTLAFDVVKYLGAAYLVYLGIRKLLASDEAARQTVQPAPLRRIFFQGIAVAVLNPKTALFFFAFLPQFVDSSKGALALQVLLLGLIMLAMAIISDSCYALAAGTIGAQLNRSRLFPRIQRYFTGSVYIGLGLAALFSGGNRKN